MIRRRYRRSGQHEDYADVCRIRRLIHRHQQSLAKRFWQSLFESLSPYSPTRRVWCIVKSPSSPAIQQYPFRALVLHLGIEEDVVRDDSLKFIFRPSTAASNQVYEALLCTPPPPQKHQQGTHSISTSQCLSFNMFCTVKDAGRPRRRRPLLPIPN